MDLKVLLLITIYAVLIQNFILSRFLGLCPFFGVSQKLSSAVGMGLAVIFVMALASAISWPVYTYLLDPKTSVLGGLTASGQAPDLTFMRTIAFILVIAVLVQFIEMVLQKKVPALYRTLGIYLPLITTNCAVLGVAVLNIDGLSNLGLDGKLTFLQSLVNGTAGGVGFLLMLILMSGLREKLELENIPKSMKGLPIAFIMAGLMAIAFMGFSGLSF
jgi:electron transport complex protein RnfA